MNIKNNKGFSLIEVLVTVGLIGILVGIAVPSYKSYKENTVSMAVQADLGNGAKVYNAKYAVDSTYCHGFLDVGLPASKDGNAIYKKGGYYGFDSVESDCSVVKIESVSWESSDKGCFKAADRSWGTLTSTTNAQTGAVTLTCASGYALKTQKGLSYEGGAPTDCKLDSNTFTMGATSNVSGLKTFYFANQEGVIQTSALAHGSFDCQ